MSRGNTNHPGPKFRRKQIRMQFSKSLLFTAVALLGSVAMQAAPVIPSTTISVGNLTFSNFSCLLSSSGTTFLPASCNDVTVRTITVPGMGIEFDAANFLAADNSAVDLRINYTVSSTTPISVVGLNFQPIIFGQAVSSVTEQVWSGVTVVGSTSVQVGASVNNVMTSFITLNGGYTTLNIQKDINLSALRANTSAQESFVQQTFATPEPGTTALLGGGLMMLGLAMRRRFSNN
jgi:hypothetical protein